MCAMDVSEHTEHRKHENFEKQRSKRFDGVRRKMMVEALEGKSQEEDPG